MTLALSVSSEDAGTYERSCTDGLFNFGSGQTKAKVTCGLNGYVSKITITSNSYAATKCAGDILLSSVYSLKAVPQEQTNKSTFGVALRP